MTKNHTESLHAARVGNVPASLIPLLLFAGVVVVLAIGLTLNPKAPPEGRVTSIKHCGDTYTVETADGGFHRVYEPRWNEAWVRARVRCGAGAVPRSTWRQIT